MARKVLASLKSILGEAQRRGLVAQNAAQPVRVDVKRREQGKLAVGRDIPSKEEVQRHPGEGRGPWRPLFITAIFTGMRSSELRGLAWDDVDFEQESDPRPPAGGSLGRDGRAEISGRDRKIPMSPMVVNALKEWRLACPRARQGRAPRATYGLSSRTATARSRTMPTSPTAASTPLARSRPSRMVDDGPGRAEIRAPCASALLRLLGDRAGFLAEAGSSATRS